VDRRAFVSTMTGGLLAAPFAAEAQPAGKVSRIGWLGNVPPPPTMAPVIAAFTDGLRQHGYVDGTNLHVEYRWAHGRDERYSALVRELVQANVQLVVTAQTPAALVLKAQANQASAAGLTNMQTVAAKTGVAVVPVSARTRDEAENAFSTLTHERVGVLLVHASYIGSAELIQIREFAARNPFPRSVRSAH